MFSLISSSSLFLISGVITLAIRFFFAFLFDASASASSISPRISYILKTNFPLIAMCFPFLRSLCTYNSFLYSAFSFYKRAFLDVVFSKAASDRLIYCFTRVSRVDEQTIELTSEVTYRNSIRSSRELSSKEQSRSFGVVIGGGVVGEVEVVIRRVERIVIRLRG
jgi:hypothetical protein